MNKIWYRAFVGRLILFLIGAVAIGWLTDEMILVLLITSLGGLVWTLGNLCRLLFWLNQTVTSEQYPEPPGSYGLWGELFDTIYLLIKRQQHTHKKLSGMIQRFQESSAALREAIVFVNAKGQIEWWNPAAEHILGLRSTQDEGQQITNLIRHPHFSQYYEKKAYAEPLLLPSPLSAEKKLLYSITLYGPENRLLIVRDNTRLHQLEQMSKDFVANVSHELRTPLTVIFGYLETLSDTVAMFPDRPLPMLPKVLQQMQSQSQRMTSIVEDLLTLAQLETADNQDLVPVSMVALIENIAKDARLFSGDRNHQIVVDYKSDTKVLGNEKELRSAISNLVFNAVKYTPDNGTIKLRWKTDTNNGYLIVKDNGIGMEAHHIPRLTERFYRIDKSRHAATGGTGLGLAIVKHVLLRHDGTLLIKSKPEKGSRFTCQFPHCRLIPPPAP